MWTSHPSSPASPVNRDNSLWWALLTRAKAPWWDEPPLVMTARVFKSSMKSHLKMKRTKSTISEVLMEGWTILAERRWIWGKLRILPRCFSFLREMRMSLYLCLSLSNLTLSISLKTQSRPNRSLLKKKWVLSIKDAKELTWSWRNLRLRTRCRNQPSLKVGLSKCESSQRS